MRNTHLYVLFVLLNVATGQNNDAGNSLAATYDGYTVVESTTSIGTLISLLICSCSSFRIISPFRLFLSLLFVFLFIHRDFIAN